MIEHGIKPLIENIATSYGGHVPGGRGLPAISYHRISSVGSQNHDGPSGLKSVRFQFTVHTDNDQDAALELAEAVETLFDGWSGDLDDVKVGNTEISNIVDIGHIDAAGTWQVSVDAIFHTQR